MEWIRAIRDTLWGTPMLILLLACDLGMTLSTRGCSSAGWERL